MDNHNFQVVAEMPTPAEKPDHAKSDWVTIVLKTSAVIVVIASLILVLFADWFSLSGMRNKTLRELDELRQEMISDIASTASKEDELNALIDSELFSSKKDFKAFFRKTNAVLKTALSCKWSLSELTDVCGWARGGIRRYQNCVTENIDWFFDFDVQDLIDEVGTAVLWIYIGFVVLLSALGIAGVGTIASVFTKKLAVFRYIFAGLFLLLLVASIVGVIVANGNLLDLADLADEDVLEGIVFKITATPVLCTLFSCGGVALGIVADKRKKRIA